MARLSKYFYFACAETKRKQTPSGLILAEG